MTADLGGGLRRVDVVLVSYNSARTIVQAVDSVRSHPTVATLIVVDNDSSDGSARLAGELANVAVESRENNGFAAGVNTGLSLGRAPFVLLLNPDARLLDEALDRLLSVIEPDVTVGAVGALLVGEEGRTFGARRFSNVRNRLLALTPIARRFPYGTLGPEYPPHLLRPGADPIVVDYLWGAAVLVRRDALERLGGLDERFFLYGEDEDLGRSLQRAGQRSVLDPRAQAMHLGGESSRGDEGVALARLGHALVVGLSKWQGAPYSWCFGAGFMAVLALRLMRARLLRESESVQQTRRALRIFARLLTGAHPRGPFA